MRFRPHRRAAAVLAPAAMIAAALGATAAGGSAAVAADVDGVTSPTGMVAVGTARRHASVRNRTDF